MEDEAKKFTDYVAAMIRDPKKRHSSYSTNVREAKAMAVHVHGDTPTEILERYRPNEPEEVRNYRLQIWKPITKSLSDKVINTVSKILNPRYFKISFPDKELTLFKDEEQLHDYLFKYLPKYGSLWTWLKESFISSNFADPNALIIVKPEKFPEGDTEILKPIPCIYGSDKVLDYNTDEWYIVYEPYSDNEGCVIYVDKSVYKEWDFRKGELTLKVEKQHDFGVVPAFFSGGKIRTKNLITYFESFIQGVRPHWDRVVEMTSDKDGSIVNHLYPERWEFQVDCDNNCDKGYVTMTPDQLGFALPSGQQEPQRIKCGRCSGTGKITNRTPYGAISVSLDALAPESGFPTPPVAYVDKDIEPLRLLSEIIKEEEQRGFSSINMEILNKVGENQSGIAKVIDRQDQDAFLFRLSSHYFDYVLPEIIYFSAYWLYGEQMDINKINEYLEEGLKISKSKEFNVLSVASLMSEYGEAKTSGANANHLKNIELDIVNTKFSNNEDERKKNVAIVMLKPFPDKTIDDLMTASAIGAVRKKDIILNSNLELLVDLAIAQDDDFLELERKDQLDVLYKIIEAEFTDSAPRIPSHLNE